ncbi:MAG: glutamate--tRNA ligase, partial [Planctomycetaceae bacterium]
QKLAGCVSFLQQAGLLPAEVTAEQREFVSQAIVALGDRLKIFSDILSTRFLFSDEYPVDDKNYEKRVRKPGIAAHLRAFAQRIAARQPWSVPGLEAELAAYCQETGLAAGDLIHALRLATTGQPVGPGVYDCLVLLGPEKTLARLERAASEA